MSEVKSMMVRFVVVEPVNAQSMMIGSSQSPRNAENVTWAGAAKFA